MKNSPGSIKFILDVMLGRLASHLLHVGYDCRYESSIDDRELVQQAHETNRVIVTRDLDLVSRFKTSKRLFVIRHGKLKQQLMSLKQAFRLEFRRNFLFTRCSKCNVKLKEVDLSEVADQIPEETSQWMNRYYQCTECGTAYWKGSHFDDLVKKLSNWGLLDENAD